MAKCEHCPIAGKCRGEKDGWQFVCEMVLRGDHSEALRLAELEKPKPQTLTQSLNPKPGGCGCKVSELSRRALSK